ncbi:MAG TPA: N,N-dimethylformamidase beta subunit family domain-containing protein, partial [Ktedonobacterales bacterium]|nr:N,N-dimethylformamidase beta subunit family domain-containing protein [Ktedonobacterales bacterium]
RDPLDRAAILFPLPVNTYQAYNLWGGSSLYGLVGATATGEGSAATKATKVSFNRPYDRSAGAGDFLAWDIHIVQWIEREGFDVSYATNVDIAAHPDSLLRHRVITSGSHDEYWTKSMRDGMEAARDQGVSLAFFGANAAYWQARLEPDHTGRINRTLVCYKVAANTKDPHSLLTLDPLFHAQPEMVTAQWRDPAINRPENALLGLMYSSYFNYQAKGYTLPDWVVKTGELDRLMVGTGLAPGMHIKGGLLGYEFDRVWDNGHTPSSLVVLSQSPVINVYHQQTHACTAYYRAESGALVCDIGSIWWGWGLSEKSPRTAYQPNLLKGSEPIKALTRNIVEAMLQASPTAPNGMSLPTLTPLP